MSALVLLAVLLIAAGGVVQTVRRYRVSRAGHRLAAIIAGEDGFAGRDELERDERGKVTPAAAEVELAAREAGVKASPDDWRAWFQLGVALGDSRQPHSARAAVRRAVALEARDPDS